MRSRRPWSDVSSRPAGCPSRSATSTRLVTGCDRGCRPAWSPGGRTGVGLGPPTSVCLTGGRVVTLGEDAAACPARSVELDGLLLAPGLIDLQVNGAAGHDTTDDPGSIWAVGEAIAATGVTAFLPTVITAPTGRIEDALAVLETGRRPATAGHTAGTASRGPVPEPRPLRRARPGVPSLARPALAAGWSRAAGVAIVTLAPDLPGSLELIRMLRGEGRRRVARALERDPRAGPGRDRGGRPLRDAPVRRDAADGHREPGIVVAVLADERFTVGTIPDTIHVHPAMLDIAWRIAGPDRFSIVTDAMAALGMPHGSFRLADREVTVDDTGPRLPDGLSRERSCARCRRAEPGRGHGTGCR